MTLYLWMHWFWITFHLSLTLGKSESHLLSTQPAMTNTTTSHQNHANIPPTQPVTVTSNITNETTDKPFKFIPKKHSESKFSKNTTTEANLLERNVTAANFDNETFTLSALNQSYSENDTSLEYVDGTEPTRDNLSAAGITGITVGCIGIVGMICAVSFVIYRNRGLNRPHVLNDRCSNPDSSGYIDDASIRDNSEEMYSLDNDSFLNSLEAMTIQNYWTDTVKHTKL